MKEVQCGKGICSEHDVDVLPWCRSRCPHISRPTGSNTGADSCICNGLGTGRKEANLLARQRETRYGRGAARPLRDELFCESPNNLLNAGSGQEVEDSADHLLLLLGLKLREHRQGYDFGRDFFRNREIAAAVAE